MVQYGFGAIPSPPDIRDYILAVPNIDISTLPKTYLNPPAAIKHQGTHSTCVAYTLASLIEFHNFKESKNYARFSTDFIYGCRVDSDYFGEGMYLRDGLKVIQKYGDVEYFLLPGNTNVPQACDKVNSSFEKLKTFAYPNRISTYYKINSLDELKYALYHDGPVAAGMKWYSNSEVNKDGVYIFNSTSSPFGHAVLIVGWDEENIIVQNSWGTNFGKNGLFYVPFDKVKEVFTELYGVTDDITNIKTPSDVTKLISPIINLALKITQAFVK